MVTDIARILSRTFRILSRRPGSSLAVVMLLALALGAASAVFSVLDAVVLSPLDLEDPEELVWVWSRHQDRAALFERSSEANAVDWRQSLGVFDALVTARNRAVTWSGIESPQKLSVVITSSDFFQALGARPALGRAFEPGDQDRSVVLLHHNFWQSELGGRDDVVGETLMLDQEPYEVVGVMPATFEIPRDGVDIFLTQRLIPGARRSLRNVWVLGRMAEETTLEVARQHMSMLSQDLAQAHPDVNQGWGTEVSPLEDHLTANVRPALFMLFGAVLLVLVIATSNAAYLLLLRANERNHELAIRQALGASRWRMSGGLIGEAIILAVAGGLGGLLFAQLALPWLLTRIPESLPRQAEVALDIPVLVFGSSAALLCGVLCGLLPALQAGRSFADPLRSGHRTGYAPRDRRLRAALVVGELTLAMVLLTTAGLLSRSFSSLSLIDPGFATENRAVVRIFTRPGALKPVEKELFFHGLEEQLAATPGVAEVGASTALPLSRIGLPLTTPWRSAAQDPDRATEDHQADLRVVTAGFLPTLNVPLLAGRLIEENDRRGGEPVTVINQTFAEQAFPGQDPVGQSLHQSLHLGIDKWQQRRIVGVVGDLRHDSLLSTPRPEVYLPMAQHDLFAGMTYVVRTEGSPDAMLETLRRAVVAFDPEQPPHSLTTLAEVFDQATARERFAAEVLSLFATFAVILAALGLYAILAATVTARRREIGIRRALGARRQDVRKLVIGEALRFSLLGIVVGWGLMHFTGRWLSSLLVGVSAHDSSTLAAAAGLLLLVTLFAAWLPVRGALRIEAQEALRDQ